VLQRQLGPLLRRVGVDRGWLLLAVVVRRSHAGGQLDVCCWWCGVAWGAGRMGGGRVVN
jgi:hypothetical protein